MKNFNYISSDNYAEASDALRENPNSIVKAGGTDIMTVLKSEILNGYPDTVVSLQRIPGEIKWEEDSVVIGAMTRLTDIVDDETIAKRMPILQEAAASVATPIIRNMGTIGGNICQDVRCWYYRYPAAEGGMFDCIRKGGEECFAARGKNVYHSVFGGVKVGMTPCVSKGGCPAGIDIPGYMEQIRAGNWEAAARIIMEVNPMPMITSRICPHPCEDKCNQRQYGDSVKVHAVERSLGDYILEHKEKFYRAPLAESGKHISVIGGGPGGLTAAYYLRRAGHAVTVYEKMEKAGGVLQYGIPHYRLPRKYVDELIKAIEDMGVVFKLGVTVGKDISVEEIKAGSDSLYFGTGAWKQPLLGIDGENLTEFGLDFLVEVNTYLKKAIGNNVLVCGGGNVAMDVALTATRLGVKSVKLVCLEGANEMPASAEEVAFAKEEGVEINNSWGLSKVVTDASGKVTGLEAKRCVSVFDEHNRFSPKYNENEKMLFEADYIILATGQKVDIDFLGDKFKSQLKSARGLIDIDPDSYKTKMDGVYAGGDVATGPNIAIRAIRAGRVASRNMSRDMGRLVENEADEKHFTRFDPQSMCVTEAHKLPMLPVEGRTLTKEDISSYADGVAAAEAGRCMNCSCVSVNPSDIANVLVALDAIIHTTKRDIRACEFFTETPVISEVLKDDEVVVSIEIGACDGYDTHYEKFRLRNSVDFAIESIATVFRTEGGVIREARLVLGGAFPVPMRLRNVESFLTGKTVTEEIAAAAGELALEGAIPLEENSCKISQIKSIVKEAVLSQRK